MSQIGLFWQQFGLLVTKILATLGLWWGGRHKTACRERKKSRNMRERNNVPTHRADLTN